MRATDSANPPARRPTDATSRDPMTGCLPACACQCSMPGCACWDRIHPTIATRNALP